MSQNGEINQFSRIITASAKKSFDGTYSKQRSERGAEKPRARVDVIRTMTREGIKMPKDPLQSPAANPKPIVHSGFGNQLSGVLPPCRTEPSMAIDDIGCSHVLNCRQPAFHHKLRTEQKYKYETRFLRALVMLNLHLANALFSKKSVVFHRNMA